MNEEHRNNENSLSVKFTGSLIWLGLRLSSFIYYMYRLEVMFLVWHDGQQMKQYVIDLSLQYSTSSGCRQFFPPCIEIFLMEMWPRGEIYLKTWYTPVLELFTYTHMNFALKLQWLQDFDVKRSLCSLKCKWNFPISQPCPLINEIVSSQSQVLLILTWA